MKDERMKTEDPRKLLIQLSIPAICAQIVTLLYNTVDRVYIGRMEDGTMAMAGIGLCVPITMVLSGLSSLFGRGGSPLAAISLGKGDREEAELFLGNSFFGLVVTSFLVMAGTLIFRKPLLTMFGASENTMWYASEYLTVYLYGTLFVQITVGMNYFITTQGFAKTAMITTMLGAFLNIILDPIFMFQLNMGIKGAALATVVSQMVSCVFVMWFLLGKNTKLCLRLKNMRIKKGILTRVLVLGASPFFMTTSEGIMHICFNMQVLKYGGDLAVSAMTILFSMFQFINLPLTGVAQGSQPIVSFNYGAGDYGRVKKTLRYAIIACTAFSLCGTTLMLLFPAFFIRLFNSDPALVSLGARMLRVYIFGCFFIGANSLYQQTYTSMGEGRMSFFFAFFRKVILLIPLLYILPSALPWGVMAVALAEPVSDLMTTFCNKLYFDRFMKKKLSSI
ncbi:MAG: MATE family efflux transporter [Hungatella sp.]|nr:MATE family efflux transporter [Hungatella sp.]